MRRFLFVAGRAERKGWFARCNILQYNPLNGPEGAILFPRGTRECDEIASALYPEQNGTGGILEMDSGNTSLLLDEAQARREAAHAGPRMWSGPAGRKHGKVRMVQLQELTDERLMAELAAGDRSAFEALVKRYQQDIFRFCLHYLKDIEQAREIAQETFLRVYTARERFDPERSFKPWLLCIARNLCLNELKRKKTVRMETLEQYVSSSREESGELMQSSADNADAQLMTTERHQALLRAVEALPEEAAEIVKLRYFERLSAREIADIVNSTEGAVRTRLHRILKQLRVSCAQFIEDV